MLQIFVDIEHKTKIIDFLLDLDCKDFYCFHLECHLNKDFLIHEKEKVNGYKECAGFMIFDGNKKRIANLVESHFGNLVKIVHSKV